MNQLDIESIIEISSQHEAIISPNTMQTLSQHPAFLLQSQAFTDSMMPIELKPKNSLAHTTTTPY